MNGEQLLLRRALTVERARETMRTELNTQGQSRCPCCERVVRVYHRTLHSEMILWLLGLVSLYEQREGWYMTTDIIRELGSHLRAGGTNGSLLVHWKLVLRAEVDNLAGAPVGSYRPTEDGLRFVAGRKAVPKCVHLKDNILVGEGNVQATIHELLPIRFSYPELMSKYGLDRLQERW
jgi:hypothetical protein